jgi:hypothetical protein
MPEEAAARSRGRPDAQEYSPQEEEIGIPSPPRTGARPGAGWLCDAARSTWSGADAHMLAPLCPGQARGGLRGARGPLPPHLGSVVA